MKHNRFIHFIAILLVLTMTIQVIPVGAITVNQTENVLNEETIDIQNSDEYEEISTEDNDSYKVVGEVESLREEKNKHFLLDDGSYMAVSYNAPVHYRDSNGKWKDINNKLNLIEDSKGRKLYQSKNAVSPVTFSSDLENGELLTSSFDDVSVTMHILDSSQAKRIHSKNKVLSASALDSLSTEIDVEFNRDAQACVLDDSSNTLSSEIDSTKNIVENSEAFQLENIESSVLYEEVFPDTDILYTAYSYNIKEQIIVNKPQEIYRYDFKLELNGLSAVLNDDGSVSLVDKENTKKYYIPAPYMEDANGISSNNASYTLTEVTDGVILTVIADENWLNAEDRAFPVAIDPTLKISVNNPTYSQDCAIYQSYVTQGAPNLSKGGCQDIYLGYGASSSVKYRYAYLYFNQLPTIPSGSIIDTAQFGMGMADYSQVACENMPLGVYEVTETKPSSQSYYNWINNLTWNTRLSFDADNEIDYVITSESKENNYLYWEITELVKKWYSEDSQNRTIAIAPSDRSAYDSTYCAVQRFEGYDIDGPQLLIHYRNNTGIESYYTYTNASMDLAGEAYVADVSGQLKIVTPILSYSSTANPVSISLVYNSDYFEGQSEYYAYKPPISMGLDTSVGHGWTLDVIQKMEDCTISGTDYKKYTDGDGTIHYFRQKKGDTTYFYDEDGLGLKVEETSSNNFTMSDDHGNVYKFTNKFLTNLIDSEGNEIIINYSNNRITSVVQKNNGFGSITVATFTYSTETNSITKITDVAGNEYKFVYSSSTGNLLEIQKNNNAIAGYVYNGRYITRALDEVSNQGMSFTYSRGKIASLNEVALSSGEFIAGEKISVTYPNSSKTVYQNHGDDRIAGNSDDIYNHYLFDYAGRTVNAYSVSGSGTLIGASNSVYTNTGSTDKTNNRTLRAASIGTTAHQLLKNTSVESVDEYLWSHSGTVISTAKPHTGLRSIKGTLGSSAINAKRVTEELNANNLYTFSAYVNTSGVTNFTDGGVYLRVTDNYTDTHWDSVPINYKTSTQLEGGWIRISVTFTAKTSGTHIVSVRSGAGSGVFYADDFQLEKGSLVSNYNMLQNSSFEMDSTYGWNLYSKASHYETLGACNSQKSIKITGSPLDTENSRAHQDVTVNLPSTETYVVSGWAAGFAVPDNVQPDDTPAERDVNKQFGIRVALYYTDDTSEVYYVPFNPDLTGWQFTSYTIVPGEANKTVERIRVICAYESNANRAYFDNICLSREVAQTMKYDPDGNLESVTSTGLDADVDEYENGNLIKKVTGGYGTYTYNYTSEENKHRVTSIVGHYLSQTMGNVDSKGNVLSTGLKDKDDETTPQLISKATYSNSGNLQTSVTDENNITTQFTYGSEDNYVIYGTPSKITYGNGTEIKQEIDYLGRIKKTAIESTAKIEYNYSNGLLNKITRTKNTGLEGMSYSFTYDSFGNTTKTNVGNKTLATYTYGSNNGLLNKITYGNGATTNYTYDILGRTKTTLFDNSQQLIYTYDGNGNVSRIKETGGNSVILSYFHYDSIGRLISSRKQRGSNTILQTKSLYNASNKLIKQNWRVGLGSNASTYTEEYTYNGYDGLIRYIASGCGDTIEINYDKLRRLSTVDNDKFTKTYTYRDLYSAQTTNQIKTIKYTGLEVPLEYSYIYDDVGNIKTITDPIDGTKIYTYDSQGQMIREKIDGTIYTYTYDEVGNITKAVKDGTTHTYTYNEGLGSWDDLLIKYNGQEIEYDEIGNPTSYYNGKRWNFTWENGRTLKKAISGNTTVTYTYDKTNNMRLSKKIGNTVYYYYYADDKLMRMTVSDGTVMDFFYDQNGQPYAVKYNGTNYYYILNQQGDVVRLVSATGVSYGTYRYNAWGEILYSTNNDLMNYNPLRYRGYVYDNETGFYYVSSRYYDPQIGRFINADNAISGTGGDILGYNMFSYCFNNPVNMSDPIGNWPKWVETAAKVVSVVAVVAAVVITVSAVSAFTAGTGSAAAVYGATIFLGAALSGINGAVANESKGNSYANGYVGGFISGGTQSAASRLPGGTVWGGTLGTSAGTAVTMGLNNLDSDSANSTASEIATEVKNSAIKATATSMITASIGAGVGGIDYKTGTLYGGVADGCGGLMPSLTLGFGEGIKAFFGAVDDALVYIWE